MAGRFSNLELPASAAVEPGSPGGAQNLARRTFATPERTAAYYLNQAIAQEMAGDLENALRSYSAALGEDAQMLDAWIGQLWVLLEQQEYPEAELWARKALGYFPENPNLLALCSLSLHRMDRLEDARAMNDAAMGRPGNFDMVWVSRGEIMLKGHRAAVEECFNHAKRLTARPELTSLRIAAVCLHNGKYQLALQELTALTGRCPSAARPWAMLGATQAKLGFADQARVSFAQAIELAPTNSRYKQELQAIGSGLFAQIAGFFRRHR